MSKGIRHIFDVKVLLGIGIIAVGGLMLLRNFGIYLDFRVWELWPLILILVGIGHITGPEETRQPMSALILIVIGSVFLSNNLDLIGYRFNIWPVIFILVGIVILKHALAGSKNRNFSSDYVYLNFLLGGGEYNYSSKALEGGKVSAIMGGGTIDLRQCEIRENEIVIDVFAFWGGFDIVVPHEWRVSLQATPILGGMENKTTPPADGYPNGKRLLVRGTVIMGGVGVKN